MEFAVPEDLAKLKARVREFVDRELAPRDDEI